MAKEGKLTNTQVMEQLMTVMTEEQKGMVADTVATLIVPTDDITNGKVCRKLLAHGLLECYQFTTGEDAEQVEIVKKGFRQLHKKYLNSNRDAVSKEESDMYVTFYGFITGGQGNDNE